MYVERKLSLPGNTCQQGRPVYKLMVNVTSLKFSDLDTLVAVATRLLFTPENGYSLNK